MGGVICIKVMSEKSRNLVKKSEKEKGKSEFGEFLVWKIFGVEMKPLDIRWGKRKLYGLILKIKKW